MENNIQNTLTELHGDEELLFADGYDEAIIGVSIGISCGKVVYDQAKVIEICMRDSEMTYEEAVEWLDFNTFGAYVGEGTPVFVDMSLSMEDCCARLPDSYQE